MDTQEKAVTRKNGDAAGATRGRDDQQQIKVSWDSSRMKTSYANVCNVSSTREEITLLFGTNQTWQPGQREVSVELTDRVILSPFAAKRLSVVLQGVIDQYEKKFGELSLEEARR